MPKKKKKEKRGLFNRGLLRLVSIAMIVGCAVVFFMTERDCAEKEEQIEAVQAKITSYENENAELQRVLDSKDLSDYMEQVALEERGYAYPDERRFYDTTRD